MPYVRIIVNHLCAACTYLGTLPSISVPCHCRGLSHHPPTGPPGLPFIIVFLGFLRCWCLQGTDTRLDWTQHSSPTPLLAPTSSSLGSLLLRYLDVGASTYAASLLRPGPLVTTTRPWASLLSYLISSHCNRPYSSRSPVTHQLRGLSALRPALDSALLRPAALPIHPREVNRPLEYRYHQPNASTTSITLELVTTLLSHPS